MKWNIFLPLILTNYYQHTYAEKERKELFDEKEKCVSQQQVLQQIGLTTPGELGCGDAGCMCASDFMSQEGCELAKPPSVIALPDVEASQPDVEAARSEDEAGEEVKQSFEQQIEKELEIHLESINSFKVVSWTYWENYLNKGVFEW